MRMLLLCRVVAVLAGVLMQDNQAVPAAPATVQLSVQVVTMIRIVAGYRTPPEGKWGRHGDLGAAMLAVPPAVRQVVAMIRSFACYLRRSGCDLLTAMQVAPPVAGAAGAPGLAALLLHPGELGRPGKTGLWDFTIVLDTYVFLVPALLGLKRRAASPTARLWSFPPASLGACMRDAACTLGLADFPVPAYGLRHGGASDDLLARRRPALEVQQRGGWASDKNFRRYAKQARIITELQRAGAPVIAYGQEMDAALAQIFLSAAPVPGPPRTCPVH